MNYFKKNYRVAFTIMKVMYTMFWGAKMGEPGV